MFPHFVSCVLAAFLQLRGESRFICGYLCGCFFHVCSIYPVCSFTMCNSQRNWLFTVKTAAHNLLYQFCSKVSQQHHYLQNSTLHFLVSSRLLLELLVFFGSLSLIQGVSLRFSLPLRRHNHSTEARARCRLSSLIPHADHSSTPIKSWLNAFSSLSLSGGEGQMLQHRVRGAC